jgi:hypothetical protein
MPSQDMRLVVTEKFEQQGVRIRGVTNCVVLQNKFAQCSIEARDRRHWFVAEAAGAG